MARLTKKQKQQLSDLKVRAESAERQLAALDSFKFSLVEFLQEDMARIARDECEEILNEARINF